MASLVLLLLGGTTAVLGRHSVLGLTIGCGMMFLGWVGLEIKEARHDIR